MLVTVGKIMTNRTKVEDKIPKPVPPNRERTTGFDIDKYFDDEHG